MAKLISEINAVILTLMSLIGTIVLLHFELGLTDIVGLYVLTILSWIIAYAIASLKHLDELRQKKSRRYEKSIL